MKTEVFLAIAFTILAMLIGTIIGMSIEPSTNIPISTIEVQEKPYIYSYFTETSGMYIVNNTILTVDNLYSNGWMVCVNNKPIHTFELEEEAYSMLDELLNYYERGEK